MRTTVNLDEELLATASEYTGIKERSTLLRMGLESLIALEAGKRLVALGGTVPDLAPPPRRRPPDFNNPE
jgi:Arc/MetJ family transcription regulator